ncbi:MAG TPA: hypothetical protein P5531_06820 [Bacteroidales bacterium]|nr:hypothetical protein [Bacteroidales bacterium]HSA44528.1 hypothetical protein [Bacteroidales bacterium]
MIKKLTPKVRKYSNLLLRLLTGIFAYTLLFGQLSGKQKQFEPLIVKERFLDAEGFYPLLVFLVALMLLNWGLESLKWRRLIGSLEKLSFTRCLGAVLTGVTISFFSPNRAGEFLGRVFSLRQANRIDASLVTVTGSFAQFIVTLVAGSGALILYLDRHAAFFEGMLPAFRAGQVIAWLLVSAALLLLYFNIGLFSGLARHSQKGGRLRLWLQHLLILRSLHTRDLSFVILLSSLRYAVFSFQACLLLRFSLPGISWTDAGLISGVFFLVVTLIPSFALAEIGIRGSVAVYLTELYGQSAGLPPGETILPALLTFTMLWVMNIALPALLGVFGLLQLRFFKETTS